jgi:hypothetical protein
LLPYYTSTTRQGLPALVAAAAAAAAAASANAVSLRSSSGLDDSTSSDEGAAAEEDPEAESNLAAATEKVEALRESLQVCRLTTPGCHSCTIPAVINLFF